MDIPDVHAESSSAYENTPHSEPTGAHENSINVYSIPSEAVSTPDFPSLDPDQVCHCIFITPYI